MNLVLPMAGGGTRFLQGGFECPKPLLPLRGKPFFQWAAESVLQTLTPERLRFVVLRAHVERFSIDRRILEVYPQAEIIVLEQVTAGAVLTCLAGCEGLPEDAPVLFNDCDHYFRCDALKNLDADVDGALLTFRSRDPRFSFAALREDGSVIRTAEKDPISDRAICGAYYFGSVRTFREGAARYLKTCTQREFFMSGVYNELLAAQRRVAALDTQLHISFGTPEEYAAAQQDARLEEAEA